MSDIYEELKDQGLEAWAILIYDQVGEAPTADYCKSYRDGHKLKLRVLYDPHEDDGNGNMVPRTRAYGDKETSIISNEEGIIVYEAHSDLPDLLRTTIESELAAGIGECSTQDMCKDKDCVLTPQGDAKICSTTCTYGDDTTCPEGEVCWRYSEDDASGACFSPDLLPSE